MRVLKGREEMRRNGKVAHRSREMATAAGIFFCILVISCISSVDGATDPGDGTIPFFLRFVSSFLSYIVRSRKRLPIVSSCENSAR